MTTYATDYVETAILNSYLRGLNFVTACPVYIALYTDSPTDSTNGIEVVASGTTLYKRISASGTDDNTIYDTSITNESGTINSIDGTPEPPPKPVRPFLVSDGSATNLYQIDFPKRGASTWNTVTHFGIVSGSWLGASGSNIFFYGPLETPFNPAANDIISFPVGSINVYLQGNFTKYIANNVLNHYINRYYPNIPGLKVTVALFSVLPDDYGLNGMEIPTHTSDREQLPTGYARKQYSGTNHWTYPATYNGITSSSSTTDCYFTYSALQDWGVIRGVGIFDSIRNQLLFTAPFVSKSGGSPDDPRFAKQVLQGDVFKLGQGFFRVTID